LRVGWVLEPGQAEVIYAAPRRVVTGRAKPLGPKAVQSCPAVNGLEARLFVVEVPFNLRLRLVRDGGGFFGLFLVPEGTSVSAERVRGLVSLMPPDEWRSAQLPVIQIATPYSFIADEECWITQLPPMPGPSHPLPGSMVCGRFPTHIWPRNLSWALEWENPDDDLVLRRSDPWFSVFFETTRPGERIDLVRARLTPELATYQRQIRNVVSYVSGTFGLFDEAKALRPARLLVEAEVEG